MMTRCLGLAGAIGVLSALVSTALADAPPSPAVANYLGVLGVSSQTPLTFNTMSANFDTEMALHSETGQLLANNDDYSDSTSRLDIAGLPTGDYYLMAIGYNTDFFDNFGVDVRAGGSSSTAGGTLLLDIAGNSFVAAVGAGRGFWYHFQVFDPAPCAADLNMDGNLDFFDVQAFLQVFSAGCP